MIGFIIAGFTSTFSHPPNKIIASHGNIKYLHYQRENNQLIKIELFEISFSDSGKMVQIMNIRGNDTIKSVIINGKKISKTGLSSSKIKTSQKMSILESLFIPLDTNYHFHIISRTKKKSTYGFGTNSERLRGLVHLYFGVPLHIHYESIENNISGEFIPYKVSIENKRKRCKERRIKKYLKTKVNQ